jgi:hypothetical protein
VPVRLTADVQRGGVSFSAALIMLKDGHRIARTGWNGKGMYLALVKPPAAWELHAGIRGPIYQLEPFIAMKTADNKLIPWLASQTDLLSEDWEVLD